MCTQKNIRNNGIKYLIPYLNDAQNDANISQTKYNPIPHKYKHRIYFDAIDNAPIKIIYSTNSSGMK